MTPINDLYLVLNSFRKCIGTEQNEIPRIVTLFANVMAWMGTKMSTLNITLLMQCTFDSTTYNTISLCGIYIRQYLT